jgi:hypothetical protein
MSILRLNTLAAKTGTQIVVPSGNTLYAPGHCLQVQVATVGPAKQTILSLTPVAITGLSIAFTPISATSKIVIRAQISTNGNYVTAFSIYKNGAATANTTGYTNNNYANVQSTMYAADTSADLMYSFPLLWSETSGSTSARTYQIYGRSGWTGTSYSLQINNRNSNDMAAFSYMTIMEIAQ